MIRLLRTFGLKFCLEHALGREPQGLIQPPRTLLLEDPMQSNRRAKVWHFNAGADQ